MRTSRAPVLRPMRIMGPGAVSSVGGTMAAASGEEGAGGTAAGGCVRGAFASGCALGRGVEGAGGGGG